MICDNVEQPRRMTKGSSCYDFYSPEDYEIKPGRVTRIDTGVRLTDLDMCNDFPRWAMCLFPRSSFGMQYGMRFSNTVGIIDMDYRDNIKASITSDVPFRLKKGERFMQGMIIPFGILNGEIEPTDERVGGIGSTGRK